jgi:heme oxygenase (biliverdin-producing, ferredoxin)
MRAGSAQAHREAESSPFVVDLLAGRIGKAGYAAYLLRLREIYAHLERHVRRHSGHEAVAAVRDPALERLGAIDRDLEFWAEGRERPASAAVADYRQRLDHASRRPELLVAHHYTRYLGDLAGGQAIGRVLARTFGLRNRGVAFYEFPGIEKPVEYRRSYRARVDRLSLSTTQQHAIVEEVRIAFALNRAVFEELHSAG